MGKFRSQAGISMAQSYQIEGGIVGVEELLSKEVHLAESFGERVFSERLQSFFIKISSGAIAQSLSWAVTAGGIPDSPNRILSVQCIIGSGDASKIVNANVDIEDVSSGRELPIYVYDTDIDAERDLRWSDDGAAAANFSLLGHSLDVPTLITRFGDELLMPTFMFRGRTTAFGAGTIEMFALIHMVRANPGSPTPGHPSSHGLPLPGW